MLVDSHCHLNFEGLVEQIPEVIQRADKVGVSHMVCICSRISEFKKVSQIADNNENVYCSVGIHPHDVEKEPEISAKSLIDLSRHSKAVGIGETGLDLYYKHSPLNAQMRSFRTHITAARETGLPVIVHTRDADEETVEILREEYHVSGPFPGVIHCFTAGRNVAQVAMDLGLYVSLSGIITFKNAEILRETVKTIPLDRILIETDSPYLAPAPHRGKQNEPSYITHTAQKAAELFEVTFEEFSQITTENFFKLFTKAKMEV